MSAALPLVWVVVHALSSPAIPPAGAVRPPRGSTAWVRALTASERLSPLARCSAGSCSVIPGSRPAAPNPRVEEQFNTTLRSFLQGHGSLGDAALWLATDHLRVDARANRFFVVLRVDGL